MTFEMPEPFGEVIESTVFENGTLWAICAAKGLFLPGTKVYTAQALRDVLEQAARIAFNATCPDGDDYAHGYNKAAQQIERAIRAMIKEIPE
jgi:hypothetical protein